jgi:hypothetical protein
MILYAALQRILVWARHAALRQKFVGFLNNIFDLHQKSQRSFGGD